MAMAYCSVDEVIDMIKDDLIVCAFFQLLFFSVYYYGTAF